MKKLSEEVSFKRPFVIYKEPGSSLVHILQQNNDHLFTDVSLKTEGFYFYPFQPEENLPVVFPVSESSEKEILYRKLTAENNEPELKISDMESLKKEHVRKVKEAIESINNNEDLQKIIISSPFKIVSKSFDWQTALLKLMKTYEESFVWAWFHSAIGFWMGATPELLASYEDRSFETMALAGTLPVHKNEALIWSGKEIREQQLVTDFIVSTLQKYTQKITVSPPQTVYQGKIAHIRTKIKAGIESKQKEEIVLALHPTPAVSGLPVKKAVEQIAKIENISREYYTGFLGKKTQNYFRFFVNLRTMQIKDNELIIYAGGGILGNSHPEKEWEEVKNKAGILYKIINSA